MPDDKSRGGSSAPAPLNTYTEYFENEFPFYLSIGMTADEFWNQDCCLARFYRKAHEIKKDRLNEELWLQGLYVYRAILDASPILHAFAKKGTKPEPYLKEPLPRTMAESKEREERDRMLRVEQMRANLFARAAKKRKS